MIGLTKTLFVMSFLLGALTSLGISHVGGGKIKSTSVGFEAYLPAPYFSNLVTLTDKTLIARTMRAGFGPSVAQYSQFMDLDKALPKLNGLNHQDVNLWFLDNSWEILESHSDCMAVYFKNLGDQNAWVVIWDIGKGLFFRAPDNASYNDISQVVIRSVKVEKGACKWNPN